MRIFFIIKLPTNTFVVKIHKLFRRNRKNLNPKFFGEYKSVKTPVGAHPRPQRF